MFSLQKFSGFLKLVSCTLKSETLHLPLFHQHTIDEDTKLAVWKIEETENFFLSKVPLQAHITHPHKRLQHLAGRYLLQYLFPDFPYQQILIADTRKPFLPNEQYHFSISHCGNYAAAIVSSTHRVGIDIENPSIKVVKIQHKFLSKNEISNFKFTATDHRPPTNDYRLPTLLWCAKESMFKWWSLGNVDFSEHLPIQYFKLQSEGEINAAFIQDNLNIPLQLQYKFFTENLCLCWIAA